MFFAMKICSDNNNDTVLNENFRDSCYFKIDFSIMISDSTPVLKDYNYVGYLMISDHAK